MHLVVLPWLSVRCCCVGGFNLLNHLCKIPLSEFAEPKLIKKYIAELAVVMASD